MKLKIIAITGIVTVGVLCFAGVKLYSSDDNGKTVNADTLPTESAIVAVERDVATEPVETSTVTIALTTTTTTKASTATTTTTTTVPATTEPIETIIVTENPVRSTDSVFMTAGIGTVMGSNTETEAATENTLSVRNLTASTISVSCIKLMWDADEGREYEVYIETYAPYIENAYFVFQGNNICYITGLRENSEYEITVTPILNDGESHTLNSAFVVCKTEQVEVIQEFPYEEGWTNCFAGEKASGLTRMPSSGAIAGSICDPITGTGIRRNEYGDYCCAMGLWYGVVGDRFLVELENGTQFTVSICDSKGWGDDADGDGVADGRFHWFGGEGVGKCIIEFIWDDGNLPSDVAYAGSWHHWNWSGLDLGANIKSIQKINYGNPIIY